MLMVSDKAFPFIPKVLDGVQVRVLSGSVKLFHAKLEIISLWIWLCAQGIVMVEHPQLASTKLEAQYCRNIIIC